MNREEQYFKTKDILEEKILACTDLEEKIRWIETYKYIIQETDRFHEVTDITDDLLKLLIKGKDIYRYDLSERFMKDHKDVLNWEIISSIKDLNREFILDNHDVIDFDTLNLKNYLKLENADIRLLSDSINWNFISMRDDLPVMFIREFKDLLNWNYVTINISLTEDEMEEFSEFIDWKMATICQVYSEEFATKHELSQYVDEMKTTSEEMIENYEERISNDNFHVSEDDKEEYYENLKKFIVGFYEEDDKNKEE